MFHGQNIRWTRRGRGTAAQLGNPPTFRTRNPLASPPLPQGTKQSSRSPARGPTLTSVQPLVMHCWPEHSPVTSTLSTAPPHPTPDSVAVSPLQIRFSASGHQQQVSHRVVWCFGRHAHRAMQRREGRGSTASKEVHKHEVVGHMRSDGSMAPHDFRKIESAAARGGGRGRLRALFCGTTPPPPKHAWQEAASAGLLVTALGASFPGLPSFCYVSG